MFSMDREDVDHEIVLMPYIWQVSRVTSLTAFSIALGTISFVGAFVVLSTTQLHEYLCLTFVLRQGLSILLLWF
jgi:hypothetical protein